MADNNRHGSEGWYRPRTDSSLHGPQPKARPAVLTDGGRYQRVYERLSDRVIGNVGRFSFIHADHALPYASRLQDVRHSLQIPNGNGIFADGTSACLNSAPVSMLEAMALVVEHNIPPDTTLRVKLRLQPSGLREGCPWCGQAFEYWFDGRVFEGLPCEVQPGPLRFKLCVASTRLLITGDQRGQFPSLILQEKALREDRFSRAPGALLLKHRLAELYAQLQLGYIVHEPGLIEVLRTRDQTNAEELQLVALRGNLCSGKNLFPGQTTELLTDASLGGSGLCFLDANHLALRGPLRPERSFPVPIEPGTYEVTVHAYDRGWRCLHDQPQVIASLKRDLSP